jgi:hypothetical protein
MSLIICHGYPRPLIKYAKPFYGRAPKKSREDIVLLVGSKFAALQTLEVCAF